MSTAVFVSGLLIAGAINPLILTERAWIMACLFGLFLALDLLGHRAFARPNMVRRSAESRPEARLVELTRD